MIFRHKHGGQKTVATTVVDAPSTLRTYVGSRIQWMTRRMQVLQASGFYPRMVAQTIRTVPIFCAPDKYTVKYREVDGSSVNLFGMQVSERRYRIRTSDLLKHTLMVNEPWKGLHHVLCYSGRPLSWEMLDEAYTSSI